MPDETQPEPRPAPQFIIYLVPVLIVMAVGALFFMGDGKQQAEDDEKKSSAKVKVDHDYYVLVTLMEFHPKKISGEKWDVSDSAPDIYYNLKWHDKIIFSTKNNVVNDVLIGKWLGLALDAKLTEVGKILMSGGVRISPLNAIKAALISVERDGELIVHAYDNDALRDDLAGQCALQVTDLNQGDNKFYIDVNGRATRDRDELAKGRGGLKRFVLRVVDSTLPIEELVKALR
jgi:hypothetical protein